MLIFIAHNGKTLELDVESSTRVDAVQLALSSLTTIPPQEQILLLNGNPLDPNKSLGAYQLPTDTAGNPKDVFLYNKAHLKANVQLPEPEDIAVPQADVPPPGSIQYEPHALDRAPSPLLQTLPNYERQFRHHLQKAHAHLNVSQQREAICRQLLSEQEVQAMSIDAARSNVERHYQYIARVFDDFIATYQTEAAAQKEILQGFERDMDQLAALQLHADIRTDRHSCLIDLIPEQKLREWAARCKRDHDHFAKKVDELKGTFGGLKLDVEAMFMQMPSVDLDELGGQLEAMQHHQQEQGSIADVLQSDLAKIESLVEEAVRQLSSAASASSVRPLDACEVMEAMNRHHLSELLPRIQETDSAFEQLCSHCIDCKNCMTKDVFNQLQKISVQQSKIKSVKSRLSVYQDVANKHAETFAELQLVKRVPVAYRHCLAECMRRQTFWEQYSRAANDAAQALAQHCRKEAAMRDVFKRAVSRLIPAQVLSSMGLQAEVPLCSIKLSPPDAALLQINSDDLLHLPRTPQGPIHAEQPFPDPRKHPQDLAASQALQPVPGMSNTSRAPSGSLRSSRQAQYAQHAQQATGDEGQDDLDEDLGEPASTEIEVMSLREQNAKLRDQLATLVFQQCLSANPPRQKASEAEQPASHLSASQILRADLGPTSAQSTLALARMPSANLAQSTMFRIPSGASQMLTQHIGISQPQEMNQHIIEERKRYSQAVSAKDDRIRELDDQLRALKQAQRAESKTYKNRIQSLEGMLTRLSLSASAEATAAAPAPGSTPTSPHLSPLPPAAAATAVEPAVTSGPLVKLQKTATRIGSVAQAASQAPQPQATAVGLTIAAQRTPATDPATAAASAPQIEHVSAAAASLSSEGTAPAAVAGRNEFQHNSGLEGQGAGGDQLGAQEGVTSLAGPLQQQADAGATAVGQSDGSAEQAEAAGSSVDSSLTSPGSFSA